MPEQQSTFNSLIPEEKTFKIKFINAEISLRELGLKIWSPNPQEFIYLLSLAFMKAKFEQPQVPTDTERGGKSQLYLLGTLSCGNQYLVLSS